MNITYHVRREEVIDNLKKVIGRENDRHTQEVTWWSKFMAEIEQAFPADQEFINVAKLKKKFDGRLIGRCERLW